MILIILIALIIPISTGLACNLPFNQQNEPAEKIPVSTQAVEGLIDDIDTVVEDIQNGEPFQLVVTEAQLTSIINYELQSYQEYQVRDVQVFLREGVVRITGNAEQNNFTLPLTLIFSIHADSNGFPQYEIVEAKVGPFDIPQIMVDQLTVSLDNAFQTNFLPVAEQVFIEDILIGDGQMKIIGYTK